MCFEILKLDSHGRSLLVFHGSENWLMDFAVALLTFGLGAVVTVLYRRLEALRLEHAAVREQLSAVHEGIELMDGRLIYTESWNTYLMEMWNSRRCLRAIMHPLTHAPEVNFPDADAGEEPMLVYLLVARAEDAAEDGGTVFIQRVPHGIIPR